MFVQQTTIYPIPEKATEGRAAAEEWVKGEQAKGRLIWLQRPYFGDTSLWVVCEVFDTLDDLQKDRESDLTDPSFRAASAKISSRQPSHREVFQFVVPPKM